MRQTDRQTNRQTDRRTDRQTDRDSEIKRQADTQTDRDRDRKFHFNAVQISSNIIMCCPFAPHKCIALYVTLTLFCFNVGSTVWSVRDTGNRMQNFGTANFRL